jgi:Cu-Zn family superoxide dismutase
MNTRLRFLPAALACGAVLALAGAACAAGKTAPARPAHAVALMNPTQGHQVKGTVTFISEEGGVRVVADLTGLAPGEHGFHVHENGDCSAPDGTSAGGHFNPAHVPHGGPDSPQHHTGDLGNISAGQDGTAHMDQVFKFLALSGSESIVGRGLIVHAGADDLKTQPTGNAGGREACGVIEAK